MNIIQIFKPTIAKILLVPVFYLISKILSVGLYLFDEGIPFVFYKAGFGLPGLSEGESAEFYYSYFFLDIVIWYLLGCIIVHTFQSFKSRR
jgi:hypothetical protein